MDGPVDHLLRNPKMRVPMRAWFYQLAPLPWSVRLGGLYLAVLARLAGQRLPLPRRCDLHQPERMAGWLVEQRRQGTEICLVSTVSVAVRVAAAATAAGLSLDGVTFYVRSEPYTEARQRTIVASGARAVSLYGCQEASSIGISCAAPQAPDDLHAFDSRYGLVQRSRQLGEGGPEIEALLVTTLSEHAAKTLLNVETGDSAEIERRDCDCKLGGLGLRTHLSNIRSFEKLTGEGMTFARTNLTQVVEAILPARFGGTSIDYQVVEEERPSGLPRLALRISPTVGPLDEEVVRAAFLETLAQDGELERYMAAFWKRANTIEIERRAPHVTPAGKVLPFQLVRARSPAPPEY
jgi:phenylacetate-coenzyme A ligase PaaK-like adenylate-forming protein